MNTTETVRKLLVKGITFNTWILELPSRIDDVVDEWNLIIDELSKYDKIVIDRESETEFNELISEFEMGVGRIGEYMEKRLIVNNIKAHIISERVKSS